MKRLSGFIALCASMLIGLGVAFIPVAKNINGSADFSSSKEFVFKVSDRVVEDDGTDGTTNNEELQNDDDALDDIIYVFKERLNAIQINNYQISKIGDDTIDLIYKTNDSYYDDITYYLTFSGSFMASTYGEEPITVGNLASEVHSALNTNSTKESNFFTIGNAEIEYRDNYPYVVIELNNNGDDFKKLYEAAKENETENSDDSGDDSEDEEETVSNSNKIFILNDWLTGYEIKDLVDNKETSNLSKSNYYKHVLFEFDATNPSSFYWNWDSEDTSSADNFTHIYFGGYDLNGSLSDGSNFGTTVSDSASLYLKSLVWLNIFNASSYKYDITLINSSYSLTNDNNNTTPLYEYLVYMNDVQLSSFLIASLVVIVFIFLLYILNYGLNGISGSITTFGAILMALGVFNFLGVEFNLGTIFGLVAILAVSLIGSMAYFYKIKKEIYNGKNFKKAFTDGYKKGFWISFDSFIVSLVAGFTAYLIPNGLISSFGIVLILGSIFTFILNSTVLRGVSWLLYNSEYVQNHPRLLMISSKLIPNLTKDEKPVYEESFKSKPNKKSKIIGFSVCGILTVASVAAMIVFSSIGGNILNVPSSETNSEVYIQQNVPSEENVDSKITDFENNFSTHFSKDATGKTSLVDDINVKSFYHTYKKSSTTQYEYYYIVELDGIYDESTSNVYYRNSENESFVETNIKEAFTSYCQSVIGLNNVSSDTISIKKVYSVDDASYVNYTIIYVAITVGISFVYFAIRYGLSKGLVGLILSSVTLFSSIGLISLSHIETTASSSLALLVSSIFVLTTLIVYFVGEKEKYKDNKKLFKEDLSFRYESYRLTNNMDRSFIGLALIISAFSIIGLLFVTSVPKGGIMISFVALILVYYYASNLISPLEIGIDKGVNYLSKRINFKGKSKKKNKKSDNDDGPSEAIFTGIND